MSLDYSNVTDVSELKRILKNISEKEKILAQDIDGLVSKKETLDHEMNCLDESMPNLDLLRSDSRNLHNMIAFTSRLADGVSGKVRQLDLAKSRVAEAVARVEDVLSLSACTDGVRTALLDEDYERAAAHIHRYLALDETMLRLTASDGVTAAADGDGVASGTSQQPESTLDASFRLLRESEARLRTIVHRQFDAAVHAKDVASIERFFKIFPLLKLHDEGLEKFGRHLCSSISEQCDNALKIGALPDPKRETVKFADLMTAVLEVIANAVEARQPLVETYYGPGRLLSLIRHIQSEADRQCRRVLELFRRGRGYDQLYRQFVVAAADGSADKGGGNVDTKSAASSEVGTGGLDHQTGSGRLSTGHRRQASNAASSSVTGGGGSSGGGEGGGGHSLGATGAKQLDPLLSEIVLLNTRIELYLRFVRRRVLNDLNATTDDTQAKAANAVAVDQFLQNCDMSCLMQKLISQYIELEELFLREMLGKAVAMDTTNALAASAAASGADGDEPHVAGGGGGGGGALTSSLVDDAFFVVQKCCRRALSSGSLDGVCAMLNYAAGCLESDLREQLRARLRQGFPAGGWMQDAYSYVQQTATATQRQQFLITLNNAAACCECLSRLHSHLYAEALRLYAASGSGSGRSDGSGSGSGSTPTPPAKLVSCLEELAGTRPAGEFRRLAEEALQQLNGSLVRPQVHRLLQTFAAAGYTLSEEELANNEANDPWVEVFIMESNTFLASFKASLLPPNYDQFVLLLTNELAARFEKLLLRKSFNHAGAIQLDRELRALVSFLTAATTWSVRDKFSRLTQAAILLNMEQVSEVSDYWGGNAGALTWRLTPSEVRQILGLRSDFRKEDIRRLKL